MEEAGAAALQVLVQNLIVVCKEEILLTRGLKKNADKLTKSLTLIQSYLDDAEKKFISDEAVKTWLKELQVVAFNADNVLDELKYHLLSKKIKSIKIEKKKVTSCFPSFNHYVRRRRMALRIKEIDMSFESTKEKATKLGLESRLASAPAAPDAASEETDSFTVDPIFIGRDNDVSKIVEMLTTRPTEKISVLPIAGMGGLGKTTLTRKVFNHEKIKTHFGEQIWVHVSKKFDAVVLLKKILMNLTLSENVEVGSREVLLEKLRQALGDKTYLLVLDDVWNEEPHKWEGFINSLSGITSAKGNCILVTTRNTEVASIVHTLDIHNLNVLSKEDCWSIIKEKALKEGEIPSEFESIGNNIAERCQGLPLAANVVGGVLRRTSKNEWISIAQDWLSHLQGDENDISNKILRLSFDHLSPPSLKKCFAYCSLFPKGEAIDKQQLIELWMAEGFLQIDPKNGMEIEGNKFFYFLLQNSLLQVAKRDGYANITHCSMHDLVHDLACSVSKGINQVQYIGSEKNGDESSSIPKEHWSTLFFRGKVSDTLFLDFKSLHVLTVMGYHNDELPSSISELIHLRYLDISETMIAYLPDSIGELYHFQTLRAGYRLRKLPSTVQYLINLRHLYIGRYTELPPNIGRLTSLQTLEYFQVGNEESHGIGELGSLKNLQGDLHIFNLENVHDQEEAESAHLFQKPKILKLVLDWNESKEGETNYENVLEGLQPHPNLKSLQIIGFKGTRFPSWTSKMAVGLNNLMEISLVHCSECEETPMMGHLPHLEYLYLSCMRNVKSIRSSFNNSSCKETIVVFPVLKRLKLYDMPNLVEWVEIELPSEAENQPLEVMVFPCLEDLDIEDCGQLRIAPTQFPCRKELHSGLPLANICGSLTQLQIEGLNGLECLPHWLFYNNQNLTKFVIIRCGNLRELPGGLHTLNSLKELSIRECPNLKSIPYTSGRQSQGLTSLDSLSITDCEELIILPCEMVESCAPSLETLELLSLSSLINLPMIIECLHKMPRLSSLMIDNVPKLIPSSSMEIGSFHNLQDLAICPAALDSSDCVNSFKKAVDGMLQAASQSLRELRLSGMDDWDSLPDSLQHLTALSSLELENFGIEEFPEWFGNLTSLEKLNLSDCKKLRRLPSVEAMRRLTKLTQLYIEDCPVLKESGTEQQSDDVDSE